jgi:hypothetical protein
MKKPYDYHFLEPILAEFIRENGNWDENILDVPHYAAKEAFDEKVQTLIGQNVLTQQEVDTLITVVNTASVEKMMLIASLQSEASRLNQASPLHFRVEMSTQSKQQRAMDWTILQLEQLGLTGFQPMVVYESFLDVWQGSQLKERLTPYRQCWWCGQLAGPGQFTRTNQKYCHSDDCRERVDSNPQLHVDCCLGEWSLLRRAYREKLRYYGLLSISQAKRKRLIIQSFQDFCQQRSEENLQKPEPILNRLEFGMRQFQRSLNHWLWPLHTEKEKPPIVQSAQEWGNTLLGILQQHSS